MPSGSLPGLGTPALPVPTSGVVSSARTATPPTDEALVPLYGLDRSACCCGGRISAARTLLDDGLDQCDAACRACEEALPALNDIDWQGDAAEDYRLRLRSISAVCDDSLRRTAVLRTRALEAA